MKIGTAFFTLILILVGFGFLVSTTLNQNQEIQDLRQENASLKQELQKCQGGLSATEQNLEDALVQLDHQGEVIRQLEQEVASREAHIQDLQQKNEILESNLLGLYNQYLAEVDSREAMAAALSQCQATASQLKARLISLGSGAVEDSQAGFIESLRLWTATWTHLLGLEPEYGQWLPWMTLLLLGECCAALYGYTVYKRRRPLRTQPDANRLYQAVAG